MDVNNLHTQIVQKNLQNFYIFTGEEIAVQNIYINQIAKVGNLQVARVDSIADIFGKLRNNSFVQTSYCYVIRDDMEFVKTESAWQSVEQNIGNNSLILLYTKLDKRSKFYKVYKDKICEFEHLQPALLKKYIKKNINLSDKNCDILIDVCEQDYSRILLEIDKIKNYVTYLGSAEMQDGAFQKLLADSTIYRPPKDAIFDFVDAVLRNKVKQSFDLLNDCYEVGEATMVMLSVLYNNTKQVLQVQTCESKDVSKSTGLTGWQIKCAKEKSGVYSDEDLVYLMKLIQKVEKGIKTGLIEDSIAMEYILVKFF